jgi:hypothetical protein
MPTLSQPHRISSFPLKTTTTTTKTELYFILSFGFSFPDSTTGGASPEHCLKAFWIVFLLFFFLKKKTF